MHDAFLHIRDIERKLWKSGDVSSNENVNVSYVTRVTHRPTVHLGDCVWRTRRKSSDNASSGGFVEIYVKDKRAYWKCRNIASKVLEIKRHGCRDRDRRINERENEKENEVCTSGNDGKQQRWYHGVVALPINKWRNNWYERRFHVPSSRILILGALFAAIVQFFHSSS